MTEASGGEDDRCGWLLEAHDEDGLTTRECGAALHFTETGYHCDRGHSHTYAEVRHTQGWDYAHDEIEASRLGQTGVIGVRMDGHPF